MISRLVDIAVMIYLYPTYEKVMTQWLWHNYTQGVKIGLYWIHHSFPLFHRYFMLHLSVTVKIIWFLLYRKYSTLVYADEPLKSPFRMKCKYFSLPKKNIRNILWSLEFEFANFTKLDNKRCFTSNNHFDVNRIEIDILLRSFGFGFS